VQLLLQLVPARLYEPFRARTARKLASFGNPISLPASAGCHWMMVLWGHFADENAPPCFRPIHVPSELIGSTKAVLLHPGWESNLNDAIAAAITDWLSDVEHLAVLLAPPVLETWQVDGTHDRRLVDYGVRYPLAARGEEQTGAK
jgi:hypothetical protein